MIIISRQLLATDWFTDSANNTAFVQPITDLSDAEMDLFTLGRSFFTIPWVASPSATTARDGLGPLFNANTCTTCHRDNSSADFQTVNQAIMQANGRTDTAEVSDALSTLHGLVIKLGQPSQHSSRAAQHMLVPDPTYGSQIGVNSTGLVKPEGRLNIKLLSQPMQFPDGQTLSMHYYDHEWKWLNYGPIAPQTTVELRQAPALVGLGLVEHIAVEDILQRADPDDVDQDGISGKANWVYEPLQQSIQLGRFGYKASQASVIMQTADAAAHDMGLTNPYFRAELCTSVQTDCQQAPLGRPTSFGTLDLPMLRLTAIAFHLTHLKAPKASAVNDLTREGQELFNQIGCIDCHHATYTSHQPDRGEVMIAPYSDFLLHDMGEGLAGKRAEFLAEAQEWRTTPLWGLGQRVRTHKRFLHDGRASSLTEAIVWHAGEAAASQDAFLELNGDQRQSLIRFLETL